jgi:hypothetical protein
MIPTSLSRPCTGWKAKQTLREDRGKNDKSGRAQLVPTRRQGDVLHAVRIRRVPLAKNILGLVCLPFVLIYLFGYCGVRSRIDIWRAGPPVSDEA